MAIRELTSELSVSAQIAATGGFARSVVNDDAGAETPAAGMFTAIGILFSARVLTPFLYFLPQATRAATIIGAVLSLVDFEALKRTRDYSRSDFTSMAGTILATLAAGVETGIVTGVFLSLALHLWRTLRPHTAIVACTPAHDCLAATYAEAGLLRVEAGRQKWIMRRLRAIGNSVASRLG